VGKLESIAELAEVSVATVSRTLANQPGVSNKLRAKVIEAAKELGYPTKPLSFVKNKLSKGIIAITGNHLYNPFIYEVIEGIEEYISSKGYTPINTHNIWPDLNTFRDTICYHRFSGLICISTNIPEPVEDFIVNSEFPCVTAGRYVASRSIDSVTADNFNGGVLATENIIKNGHRRIALMSGPLDSSASYDRLRGYREVLIHHGLFDEHLIYQTNLDYPSGYNTTAALLKKTPDCTAIFAPSDITAIGVLDALYEKNFKVPDDISVVGFDNIEMTHYNMINLTTVHHPKRDLGQAAAERLIQLIEGTSVNQRQHVVLPVELILRKTLAPVKPKLK